MAVYVGHGQGMGLGYGRNGHVDDNDVCTAWGSPPTDHGIDRGARAEHRSGTIAALGPDRRRPTRVIRSRGTRSTLA